MSIRKLIIIGCATGASFFIGCNPSVPEEESPEAKQLEIYEPSEMALLMRRMYEDNLTVKEQLMQGEIPSDFPEVFNSIHTAAITNGMVDDTSTFQNLANQYIRDMEAIVSAESVEQAKIHYNDMIMTCASCHQIYCQGPLSKIRKMKIRETNEAAGKEQG